MTIYSKAIYPVIDNLNVKEDIPQNAGKSEIKNFLLKRKKSKSKKSKLLNKEASSLSTLALKNKWEQLTSYSRSKRSTRFEE